MKFRKLFHKKIVLLNILFACLLFSIVLSSNQPFSFLVTDNETIIRNNPKEQSLPSDNTINGIGNAWNITHWANRMDNDIISSFDEGSSDIAQLSLFSGWNGYNLNASIKDLYDTRNWNNGSYNFGADDGSYLNYEDDSSWIENPYQNWTFQNDDVVGWVNNMSGNYLDTSAPLSGSQDCLELRMSGDPHTGTGGQRYRYDQFDACSWQTSINIPRGKVIDSFISFRVNPIHLISFNSWELTVSINTIQIFTTGIYTLKLMGLDTWHNLVVPQGLWSNTSDVYTVSLLNDTTLDIEVALEYTANSASYGVEDGENIDYQQILIDEFELSIVAEALPSDLGLMLNQTYVNDIDWGLGDIELQGDWYGVSDLLDLNFSSDDISDLGTYSVDLLFDATLYARKDFPESNYETNVASLGTNFLVTNGSDVSWLTYGRVEVPSRYSETLMKIEFPTDVDISSVFDPQNPAINILNQCDNSTPGELLIPIDIISGTPDGFWKFEAVSPNYCEGLTIYNNASGGWVESDEFKSGDFVNITANIRTSPEVSGYLQNTEALMYIRFPNGTIWDSQNQQTSVDINGNVVFNVFKIPETPPFYQEGMYEAIITWNNSYSSYGINESGLIYKTFNVIHNSILEPDQLFYEDVKENTIINLKVSFNDLVTLNPISNAVIYTHNFTHPSLNQYFSEISPGYYLLEFNLAGGILGNNSLSIYANSTYFINKMVDITIEIIRETTLTVDNDFLSDVPFGQNFTIQFNYTEKSTSIGIDPDTLFTDWAGDHYFSRIIQGQYNLICNTSGLDAGELSSLNLFVDAYQYEAQSIEVQIFITELSSTVMLLINDTLTNPNDVVTVEVSQKMNITLIYEDILGNPLSGATVNLTTGSFSYILIEDPIHEQYTYILDAFELGQGVENINIFAHLANYEPQSIPFVAQVTERSTLMSILFDGVNVTSDPTIEKSIGQSLNITIKYTDIAKTHIPGSLVVLSGDVSATMIENPTFGQYSYLLDTSQLSIGLRIISVVALRTNFQLQIDVLRIVVNRIATSINTTSGNTIIRIPEGQSARIEVVLLDLIFGGSINNATVSYAWRFGQDFLIEIDDTGVYEAVISNIPVGSYTIVITADKGDEYQFNRIELTVTVIRPAPETLWFWILLIAATIGIVALTTYLILYQKIFKYPKQIRKVRKYRKTLSKSKSPKGDITSQEKAFNKEYAEELNRSSKYLKGKPSDQTSKVDKFTKEPLDHLSHDNVGGAPQ